MYNILLNGRGKENCKKKEVYISWEKLKVLGRFELPISCLLDRRLNQLGHRTRIRVFRLRFLLLHNSNTLFQDSLHLRHPHHTSPRLASHRIASPTLTPPSVTPLPLLRPNQTKPLYPVHPHCCFSPYKIYYRRRHFPTFSLLFLLFFSFPSFLSFFF